MNSKTIARNSFWYGLESAIGMGLTFFTSIAIARSVGPVGLGHFIYVWWLVNTAGTIGSLGIPMVTRKYMSEYLGRGEPGMARSIFFRTLRIQVTVALSIAVLGLILVITRSEPEYRLISALMVLSVVPAMINAIPSQANMAAERMSANVPGGLASTGIFVAAVFLSLYFGWGLLGISAGMFTMRAVEMLIRMIPVLRWVRKVPAEPLTPEVQSRMFNFSRQSLVLLALGLIVWDRSELFFLRQLCTDIRQVAFYSVAFNITERLLQASQVFGQATGSTLMAQYGRDRSRLAPIMSATARYLGLVAFPVHFGLAALAFAILPLVYGSRYNEAIPALIIASLLGVGKAFLLPAQNFYESMDRQDLLLRWSIVAGVINIALDLLLIPRFGATGAAVANGTTQIIAVLILWVAARQVMIIKLPMWFLTKTLVASSIMAAVVSLSVRHLAPLPAVFVGLPIGAVVYFVLLRLFSCLEKEDRQRFTILRDHLPGRFHRAFDGVMGMLVAPSRDIVPAQAEL